MEMSFSAKESDREGGNNSFGELCRGMHFTASQFAEKNRPYPSGDALGLGRGLVVDVDGVPETGSTKDNLKWTRMHTK